ncbi:MAG: sodium/proton-translocating pyrophosphatase [Solirubrobacterales bacterium]
MVCDRPRDRLVENVSTGIGFVIGGVLSGAAGYIGMNVSVPLERAPSPKAAAAAFRRRSNAAFKGGSVTGLLVVGLALLGVAGYFGILKT